MYLCKFLSPFLFLLLPYFCWAQFKLSAEIRPRIEFRDGFKRPLLANEKPAFFIEQRSRLYFAYHSDQIELMLAPQDIRIWGNTDQAAKTDRSLFNMAQAWAAYRFNEHHRIVLGRMELDYDNARILGNLDWAQQGRSHDLMKYEYHKRSTTFHLGTAFNQTDSLPEPTKLAGTYYGRLNNYKTMQFAWLNQHFKKHQISILALNEGRQYAPDTVYYSQTVGTYSAWSFLPITLTGEYYFQTGKNKQGISSRAHLAAIAAKYHFNAAWQVTLGDDFLTGDKPNTQTNEAFDPLYGTQHKFYGAMDYFYAGNGHANKGLNDLFIRTSWTHRFISASLDAHYFHATSAIYTTNNTQMDSYLGTELDATLSYAVDPSFSIKGGYSHLFYNVSLAEIKQQKGRDDHASWAWIMFVFKPILFQQ